jgi:delta 1-pyrroline-5-carboxylate dehydrogenase
VLVAVAATGDGLTLGIESRIDETIAAIHRRLRPATPMSIAT